MKTNSYSPFFSLKGQKPVTIGQLNPFEVKQWLRRQENNNKNYFKGLSVKSKVKKLVKQYNEKEKTQKYILGKTYDNYNIYLTQKPKKLPKITYAGYELDFNYYLNEQAYSFDHSETHMTTNAVSPCGKYLVVSFTYKNSDLEKILFYDFSKNQFIKSPWDKTHVGGVSYLWTMNTELIIAINKPHALFKREKGLDVYRMNLTDRTKQKILSQPESLVCTLYYNYTDKHHGVYIGLSNSYTCKFYYKDLDSRKPTELVKDLSFEMASNIDVINGHCLYTENHSQCNNGRIVLYNHHKQVKKIVVPEYKHLVLHQVSSMFSNYIVATYLDKSLKNIIKAFDFEGNLLFQFKCPLYGEADVFEVSGVDGEERFQLCLNNFETEISYEFSFTQRRFIKKVSETKTSLFGRINTHFGYYTSFDGEKIPYFQLTPKKDAQPATMLYAYGSFYDPTLPCGGLQLASMFIELGGTVVMPCIRGGGDKGLSWNRAGAGVNKINGVRDYLCAAEFLFKKGIAKPETLIAHGVSAGGLVVAAALNFAPTYFKAGLPFVGLMDMLNYQTYSTSDNWTKEFGKIESLNVYKAIARYCPVNKVKEQSYPSIFAITGSHDVRVAPLHTYKYVDKVQRFNSGTQPIILENVRNHGHFAHREIKAVEKTILFLIEELQLKI